MTDLRDKILGCLIGGLLGDAMGGPTEGLHYEFIAQRFGEITDPEGTPWSAARRGHRRLGAETHALRGDFQDQRQRQRRPPGPRSGASA